MYGHNNKDYLVLLYILYYISASADCVIDMYDSDGFVEVDLNDNNNWTSDNGKFTRIFFLNKH